MREVLIPKAKENNKVISIASPRDKIVQKAMELIISAIWEPKFKNSSHGFRQNRSVHSALLQLYLHGSNYS